MEDSWQELVRHLPIWMEARGHVLVTGLGLGCVVRGLLVNQDVDFITVIEKCPHIARLAWPEFVGQRCELIVADALTYQFDPLLRFDYAWHDIWAGDESVAPHHSKMIVHYLGHCRHQGAWGMPRWWRRRVGGNFVINERI